MPILKSREEDEDIEGNTTPFIDIIFLLLVFFILTTKFLEPEQVFQTLLAPEGPSTVESEIDQPDEVNIGIIPGGLGIVPSQSSYSGLVYAGGSRGVTVIINNDQVEIGPELSETEILDVLTAFLHPYLEQREVVGSRPEQAPVYIHAYSGLPWKYVAWTMDVVRDFEIEKGFDYGAEENWNARMARRINYAAPRLRTGERGRIAELFEIAHVK